MIDRQAWKLLATAALFTACAAPTVERRTYDVAPRGAIDLSGSTSLLPAGRCFDRTADFRDARWLENRARAVHQVLIGPSPGDMKIQLDGGPPLAASRVVGGGEAWWGYWDDGRSTFAIALRCKKACDVTMSVVRRADGADRFAASCVERWMGSATKRHGQNP